MSRLIVTAELYCPSCAEPTAQEVHYVAGLLHRVTCQVCGRGWDIGHGWLRRRYLRYLPIRLASKPTRLADEARLHPLEFALRLPGRLLTKPFRMATEVGTVVGLLDD